MPRFRITLAGISAIILVAALIFAAARSPTEPWANGAFSFAVLVLLIALLGALFGRGPTRTYWAGFAMLGWAYVFLAFGPWCDHKIAPLLITKTVGEYLHGTFQASLPTRPFVRRIPGTELAMFGYQQIIHSLTALLMGQLGGAVARRFAAREAGPGPLGGRE